MTSFDDWICDHEMDVYETFKTKYGSRIKGEWEMKYKDSYPDYEQFLEEEMDYITDTLLEDEWMECVNDEHVNAMAGEADRLLDERKDRQMEESMAKNQDTTN